MPISLSILDLIPVRDGQTTGQALAASVELARVADAAGYERLWVAEHHNMLGVASTNPPVLISMLASATDRIRLGSGGVMLPNHTPLVVAEQFALLEAAYPGRIDIGLGRAPGSDPVTNWALRNGRTDDVDGFENDVVNLATFLSAEGAALSVRGQQYELRATPKASSVPEVWLLGSSDYSARLAAKLGLPYVFANHFFGRGTAEALALYRGTFQPSEFLAEPKTFLTVNAVVADSVEEARRRALPNVASMIRLRTGQLRGYLQPIEDAEVDPILREHPDMVEAMLGKMILGTPDEAAHQIADFAAQYDVDEVMISPVAGEYAAAPADRAPNRCETVRALAAAVSG
jgi:luciferase family oxidoreductase group 1